LRITKTRNSLLKEQVPKAIFKDAELSSLRSYGLWYRWVWYVL